MAPDGVEPSHADSKPLYPLSYGAQFGQSRRPDGHRIRSPRWRGRASVVALGGRRRSRRCTRQRARRSQPFRALQEPRAYAEWAFSEQDEADVWFGEPIVNGDRATCEYWGVVSFQGRDGTIAGVAVIRFDADGLVSDQRDYWNAEEGRREPLDGWA